MISFPHLAITLLFDVLRLWNQYLNRCDTASASRWKAPGASISFYLKQILVNLEGASTSDQSSQSHWPTLSQEGGQ